MLVNRVRRQRGAVLPQLGEQVDIGSQPRAAFIELACQGSRRSNGENRPINGHHALGLGLVCQPFERTLLAGHQFHQLDATAGQLFGGLFPVAAVSPYAGKILRDDQCTDRAVKTRQPLAPLPIAGQVFGEVRIR